MISVCIETRVAILVYLVGRATLVWTKHDDVWRGVGKLLRLELLVIL